MVVCREGVKGRVCSCFYGWLPSDDFHDCASQWKPHTRMCKESNTSRTREAHCGRSTDISHVGASVFCSRPYSKPLVHRHISTTRPAVWAASGMTRAVAWANVPLFPILFENFIKRDKRPIPVSAHIMLLRNSVTAQRGNHSDAFTCYGNEVLKIIWHLFYKPVRRAS